MTQRAFLLGGSGQTGRALVPRLRERGWEVIVASRGERELPEGVEHVQVDRTDPEALRQALGTGADVLVDVTAFDGADAERLLSLRDLVGSLVVLSSAAVYFPEDQAEWATLPVPIPERHPTVEPGPATYASKKRELEVRLLTQDALPVTLVRAGAIHGPHSAWSREWYFVKRVLDGRRVVLLGHRGESRFHPISVQNLAELIRLAAERPGLRVLNAGDPVCPTVLEISRAVAGELAHAWTELLVDRPSNGVGDTPWSAPHPVVLDMTEAELDLRYRPVTTYERALPETVSWLVEAIRGRDWREVLPRSAELLGDSFDYDAEDAYVRGLTDG